MARAVRIQNGAMTQSDSGRGSDDALARRAQDLQSLREAEQETGLGDDQREVTGELSLVGQHPADVAGFTFQREMQETTRQLLDRETQQVEAAMRARQTGRYGTCQECGRQIPAERLAARPEATLCVDCQRRVESGRP
jgi:RNA polymerase-binding transcription factor DksA